MISIVCVYNRPEVFNKFLRASLDVQDAEYELIAIDNSNGSYKSAAQALNSGGSRAKGDYVMFAHQDISFPSHGFLTEAERMLGQVRDLGAAGLAGKRNRESVLSHMTHGEPPSLVGNSAFTEITEVQTLDECLIIVPRILFDSLKFDENVCDGWHLYAVDYSLSAKQLGFRIVVLPLAGYHRSGGFFTMGKDYYRTLRKVFAKHRAHHRWIFTSMGNWDTRMPVLPQRCRNEFKRRWPRAADMLAKCLGR